MHGDRYKLYAEPDGGPQSYLLADNDLAMARFQAERIADLSPAGTNVVVYLDGFPLFAVRGTITQPGIWG